MDTIKFEDGKPEKFKLTDKERRAIDVFVNGSFIVGGIVILFGGVTGIDFRTYVAVLGIYIGVRFFPRW